MRYIYEFSKYVSVLVILSISITFTATQAFASIDVDASIFINPPNPASIDFVCYDPVVSGGTIITGNVLDIDDSSSFDSIDISASGLICDGYTVNKISTASLIDGTSYNVRLTVSTDDSGDSIYTDSFLQPDSNAAILVFKDATPGPKTIQFRDISVTNGIEPSINIPDLFPSETGTLTVTDHNANVDLTSKELITIQINGVDVVLEETDVNTGIFEHTVNAGDSVSYDPGTLGLARATINFEFDADPEGALSLVPFTSDEMYMDNFGPIPGAFDPFDVIYRDADGDGIVSDGDIRLAHAQQSISFPDGSVVNAATFDFDIGLALVPFSLDEMHEDSGATTNVFDIGETVYKSADASVSAGDTRLANAVNQGFSDGSIVTADAFDGKGDIIVEDMILDPSQISSGVDGITPITHPFSITFTHGGIVKSGTDMDVTMSYADFVANDASLLQMSYQNPALAYGLITSSADTGSHDDNSKTIVSNPTFPYGVGQLYNSAYPNDFGLPLHTVQGRYILGFDAGGSGSGSGGITRGGFVLNALGFLKTIGGGAGGNSPASFGKSSFAIISGGEEGFGGIINNQPNTLDQTQTFKVGEKAEIRFDFTEGGGIGKIEHIGLFTNIRDGQKKYDSDTYINYDPLKSPQVSIHDPNGLFSEATFQLLQKDTTNFVLKYDLTFAKPMQKSDLILESWNTQKWLSTNKIPNAIEVVSSGIVSEQTQPEKTTFDEDITNDHVIPVWVKSNAKWWSDGTLDNENFISGIEYLVNEGIIKVPTTDTSTGTTISEIQPWIKNNAGWWADDMISDNEFVTSIQWLISNNIIKVA